MGFRECRDEMETEMMYKFQENLGRDITNHLCSIV